MKKYDWGYIRKMTEEEYDWFNKINKNLPGKKERMIYIDELNGGKVLLEGCSWTPYGFARKAKDGIIVAKYSKYDKYCYNGTILRDVDDI